MTPAAPAGAGPGAEVAQLKPDDEKKPSPGVFDGLKNSLSRFYSKHVFGPHEYEVRHRANTALAGETPEQTTERTAKGMRMEPAPGSLGREATEKGKDMLIPLGKINSQYDPAAKTVTNEAKRPHLLRPGTVTRKAEGEDIITHGVGQGLFPSMNNLFAGPIWGRQANIARRHNDPVYAAKVEKERRERQFTSFSQFE